MKKEYYKKYTKKEMTNIGKNKGFYFIETSNGETFEIASDDLVDFIILEVKRCKHHVDIAVFAPSRDEPILTTYGWYLNKVNPKLREEIIDRLVKLQKGEEKPKPVKIFDNNIFWEMNIEEFGEEEGKTIQFDKFFKKYYEGEELELE